MERGQKIRSNQPRILTNDPSFTAWGWAILDGSGRVFKSGCIKTGPDHKKKRIRVSDDRTRRAAEIVGVLLDLIKEHDIQYILSESPHGSQNANAAIMIGIVTGITITISKCLNIPIEYYSEQDAKKCALGKKAATKQDMINRMCSIYNDSWVCNIKYIDEAVADALAIHHVASKESNALKMLNK